MPIWLSFSFLPSIRRGGSDPFNLDRVLCPLDVLVEVVLKRLELDRRIPEENRPVLYGDGGVHIRPARQRVPMRLSFLELRV